MKASATLLETVMGLPMGQDGALVFEDITEVRPYSECEKYYANAATNAR